MSDQYGILWPIIFYVFNASSHSNAEYGDATSSFQEDSEFAKAMWQTQGHSDYNVRFSSSQMHGHQWEIIYGTNRLSRLPQHS